MAQAGTGGHVAGLWATNRGDTWWVAPFTQFFLFSSWVLYFSWAAYQGQYYAAGPYLSPFYAPLFFSDPTQPGSAAVEHAFFGEWPGWWPAFLPPSPAFLIFLFPASFRATCYYYRKMYYRAYFQMPPGCAVGGVAHDYNGERGLLLIQNLHRYTVYFAVALLPFLFYESARCFVYEGQLGIGLGGVLITLNAVFLTGYTFGCHAWRHLVGGRLNCFSCGGGQELQHTAWSWSSWLNHHHMFFAWLSLGWIAGCDIYVRLLSHGVLVDPNTWGGF